MPFIIEGADNAPGHTQGLARFYVMRPEGLRKGVPWLTMNQAAAQRFATTAAAGPLLQSARANFPPSDDWHLVEVAA